MSEWTVVTVIVALVGLLTSIGVPVIRLNTSITQLIEKIGHLEKSFEALKRRNSESHDRIWKHNDEQDDKIEDHELRITVLESKKGE